MDSLNIVYCNIILVYFIYKVYFKIVLDMGKLISVNIILSLLIVNIAMFYIEFTLKENVLL